MSQRVGFIGLGHMGAPMARRILDAGLALSVYNRSPKKAAELVQGGARQAGSPAEVARESDIVISMLADGPAMLDVALGENGVLAGARPGLLYIDMSTVSPTESARVAEGCQLGGVDYLRAPVTGSTVLARAGTLGILVSGPKSRYQDAVAVLGVLGQQHFYLGSGEEARFMKLTLNMMVGVTMAAFAEALVLGEKAGLDWQQMLDVVSNSAIASPFVKYKAPPLARRDFAPAFTVRGIGKDFDLALEATRQLGVTAPVTGLVRQLWQATEGSGWGDQDLTAILLFLEQASGIESGEGRSAESE